MARNEWSEEKGHKELDEAVRQLRPYASDPRVSSLPHFTSIALVFCGRELKIAQAIE